MPMDLFAPTRRTVMAASVAGLAAGGFASLAQADTAAIRPFRVRVPEADLADLRRRIAMTRWPEKETVTDDSQGVPLGLMRDVARHWGSDYDWRRCEAKLNALPQFMTTIDGLDIHFIHVRSKHANALPVIVTHGWPGSVLEQLKLIGPLTDPTAHGGTAADAFHVVIPSVPGYGFSTRPTTLGWGPARIGAAWTTLMKRLGYSRFVAQGGDIGSAISQAMAKQAPPELAAIHVNLPSVLPPEVGKAIATGAPPPATLSADERRMFEQVKDLRTLHFAYAQMMSLRPQTLTAIADSPVGLAAWLIDHGDGAGQPAAAITAALRRPTGPPNVLTRDDVLDNISLFWLTNTGVSAARFYWENQGMSIVGAVNLAFPTAISVFPHELYQAPRSWTERAYPKLIYFNEAPKGGHFAAWEEPEVFATELRNAFRALRTA